MPRLKLFLLLFVFTDSINAQIYQKTSEELARALKKCAELNEEIEQENDHTIWIKLNVALKQVAAENLKRTNLAKTERDEFRRYLAIAWLNDGAYYNYVDQYAEAIVCYKKSLGLTIPDKNYELSASNYQNIATAHDFLGNLDSTLLYLQKALVLAKQSGNESNIAYVLTDLGYTYKNIGDYPKAIDNNIAALKLFSKLADDSGLERTYFAIARIFYDQREFQKSKAYYLKGLKIAEKSNDFVRQCLILNGLATVYLMEKEYPKSNFYAQESLLIAKRNNLKFLEASAFRILGETCLNQGVHTEAQHSLTKASQIFTGLGNTNHNAQTLLLLANSYLATKNYAGAEQVLSKAYAQAVEDKFPRVMKDAAELLSVLHQNLGDYKMALFYQQEARQLSDSLFRDENKNAALKAEFAYQSELKETQLKTISQEKQLAELRGQRKNTLIYSIIFIVLLGVALTYFVFNRFRDIKENELLATKLAATERQLQIEEQAKNSELKALKSQMNPHFMFNALNSIQEQFMYGDKNVANEQMGNFTYLTRQILSVSGRKKIKLSTEIEILTKYLELEKMRFAAGFTYEISVGKNIDQDYHQLPPMLIQPFIENSVRHGLLHKYVDKIVKVHFELDTKEENLVCTVEDNGIGRKKAAEINKRKRQEHESFSIAATSERLQLMSQNGELKDFIHYQDLENKAGEAIGTKVSVIIPLG